MWYVIQTMKGKEHKVHDAIARDIIQDGEEVFVFENELKYRIKGEWILERKPFFPGYIFVELEPDNAINFDYRLRKDKHPLKLLTVDGVVTPIKPEEEDYLTRLGGEDHIIHHSEGFRVDDMVEITSGSFKGYKGEIRKIDRHKRRARITVPLMGQNVEVEIGLEIVKSLTFEELDVEAKINRMNVARIVRRA